MIIKPVVKTPLSLNQKWVWFTAAAAYSADHIHPCMAACEAALESNYGQSSLAREGLNLFGTKQHVHPVYGTLNIPTKEYIDGDWKVVDAAFVKYHSIQDCFADRMDTLMRLRDVYPEYDRALQALDPELYVTEVSKRWSTDPERAVKCIALYREYFPPQPQTQGSTPPPSGMPTAS